MKTIILILVLLCINCTSSLSQYQRYQKIVGGEYFFNSDPGEGNGFWIPTDTLSEVNINIPLGDVPIGTRIYIRFKSTNGTWSGPRCILRREYFTNSDATLTYGEYFINTDPGRGNGTPIGINPDGSIILNNPPLKRGDKVFFRVKDSFNRWCERSRAAIFNFEDMYKAEYYLKYKNGGQSTSSSMNLSPPNDSTSIFTASKNGISYTNFDTVLVRFQTFDRFLSKHQQSIIFIPPPIPVTSASALHFGDVIRGDTLDRTISVWNNSINPLLITSATKSTAVFATDFTVPDTVFQNDTIRMTVRFSPQIFKSLFIDTLVITSNGGITRILLTGSSPYPTLIPSTVSVNFLNVHRDSTVHRSVKISNSSINTLMIDSIYTLTKWFQTDIRSGSVSQGDSLSITLAFTPDTLREYIDTLLIRCNSRDQLFRIPVRGIGALTGVSLTERSIPHEYDLYQNYPNPFNPSTTIKYALPQASHVSFSVFNTLGQRVALLVDGKQEAGYHEVNFNATGLTSGVYFYRLHAGDYIETKKLILMK